MAKNFVKMQKLDIFDILQVSKHSDIDIMRSKCQKLIKENHPDKNGGQESQEFLTIMKVWKIIADPKSLQEAKAASLAQKSANWDTLVIEDMILDKDEETYVIDCRCGDQYRLPKNEICDNNEVCLECDTCSNTITVSIP